MNRRKLLKLGALASGALTFPHSLTLGNRHQKNNRHHQGFITVKLNDLEILLLSDGHISLNNPQPIFAPDIDVDAVQDELERIYLPKEKLESGINVMLIKTGRQIVLIDTGSGFHFGDSGGWLLNNLENAGIQAGDVTDIMITHAHIDHIGGISGANENLIYPNARYYMAKKEYDFWMSSQPDFSKSKNPGSQKDSIAFAQNVLGSIKDRLRFFDYGDVLFSCLETELAEGHTPGHTIFNISSGDKSIKHIVDVVHTPLLISRPEWGTQWDVDFDKAVNTRRQILESCHLERTLVMTTHLPWPGLGYIAKNGNDYHWVPLAYYTPDAVVL